MKYRSDIDGLRALAIVPVVLYHANLPETPGGFVGVDIFFVISGYLICGMVDADLRSGTFSLANFYKRRALRILPALFVMFLVTSGLAYVYCLPVELEQYARSLASAALSISNIYFAATTGYFDAPAETKPLLHTWSLGVEEQFYLVVPLLMMLVWRHLERRATLLFAAASLFSLAAALALVQRNATFVFYLTPFRAWELGLGGLLALGVVPLPRSARARTVCGTIGLLMILAAILLGSSTTPLLLMTSGASVGAALIIASSESELSAIGRLLSLRPLVFIGVISYSIYLWHWPLIVFQRSDAFLLPRALDAWSGLLLVTLSICIGWLSYRLVELPFRSNGRASSAATVFTMSAASIAVSLLLCAQVLLGDGASFRFPARVVRIAAYLGYDPSDAFREGRCYLATNRQHLDQETCLSVDASRPNYLLLGDSHAAHLWLGLSTAMPEVNLMQASASACRPVIVDTPAFDTRACPRLMRFIFDEFLANHRLDGVLLAASWKDEDLPALSNTLEILRSRGINVTVFGPIVEYEKSLPRLIAEEILRNDPKIAGSMRTPGIIERDRTMARMAARSGARYVSVYDAICRLGRCDEIVAAGDVPMQFDAGHLTAQGSIELGSRLRAAFGRTMAGIESVAD